MVFAICRNEGISPEAIHLVGNTIDSLLCFQEKAESSNLLEKLSLRAADRSGNGTLKYALLTLHRPSNVDHRETFLDILGASNRWRDSGQLCFRCIRALVNRSRNLGWMAFLSCARPTAIARLA